MNTKSKKTSTKKKTLTDTALIRLRKSTLAILKNIKADKYRDEEITYSYDKLIKHSLTETFKVN